MRIHIKWKKLSHIFPISCADAGLVGSVWQCGWREAQDFFFSLLSSSELAVIRRSDEGKALTVIQ